MTEQERRFSEMKSDCAKMIEGTDDVELGMLLSESERQIGLCSAAMLACGHLKFAIMRQLAGRHTPQMAESTRYMSSSLRMLSDEAASVAALLEETTPVQEKSQ